MASNSDRRKQQKREKKRLKDKQRRQAARVQRRVSKVRDLSRLAELPLGESYASDNWHEQGPESVWVATSRVHPNGKLAAMVAHLDLRRQGILAVEVFPELKEGQLEFEIGRRAGEQIVASCEPELVAALLSAASELTDSAPSALAEAEMLLGDIDPDDCLHEILVGPPPPQLPPKPKAAGGGLLSRLKGLIGR
jgi:hypothetical protein